MSTNPQPIDNGKDIRKAEAKARQSSPPQFISLSELAHQRTGAKELGPLIPAMIVSVVLNTALVVALLWTNSGRARAGDIQTVRTEEQDETKMQQDKEFIDIDVNAGNFDLGTEPLETNLNLPFENMAETPMIATPNQPQKPETGSGGKEDKGFIGDDSGPGALPGQFLDPAAGFIGKKGSGPAGEGGGLDAAGGGGKEGGFGRRNEASIKTAVRSGGGNDASEKAVGEGLKWLARHQGPDGRWSLDKYHLHAPGCNCKDPNFEGKEQSNDTAATAFGLLPYLAAGQTHKRGTFQKNIHAGLRYLLSKQDSKGDFGGGMYSHGLAAIAMCEAYGMTNDQVLRESAQKALNFIVFAQTQSHGGWRYSPRSETGDTSVVAWMVMALRSGQMAGLNVPAQSLQGAKRFLDSVAKDGGSKYSYEAGSGPTPAMTAAGLLNRQYLGWGPRNPDLHKGCQYLVTHLPPAKATKDTDLGQIYYYYYASQVMHHMGGQYWEKWNPLMRDFLINTQQRDGHRTGSWNPKGADHGGAGGRMYSTSLAILTLEVYYRHLPLYRREAGLNEGAMDNKKEPDKKEPDKKDPTKK